MKRTALKRKTPLKAKTQLKPKTKLKPQSQKAKLNEAVWQRIKFNRAMFLMEKYGVVICEYCGRPAFATEWGVLDAHHIDGRHFNSVENNCYICHRICHDEIKAKHLTVKQLGFEGKDERASIIR
jgi:5-methylcytosine-specific restriction endonuclease McrA